MRVQAAPPEGRSFAEWNEEMVRRYDIDRYYREAHFLVRWIERRRIRALHRLALPRPGERLLEVGVGGGHVLQQFGETSRTGMDLSPAMLERARGRLGPAVPLVRGDAGALPFRDGSFEIVLCTEVLEHTPVPGRVLAELVRLAAPGARVVVSIPNEQLIDRIKRVFGRVPLLRRWLKRLAEEDNEWHLHRFDLQSLRRIAAGTAELVEVRGVPAACLPIRYAVLVRSSRSVPTK